MTETPSQLSRFDAWFGSTLIRGDLKEVARAGWDAAIAQSGSELRESTDHYEATVDRPLCGAKPSKTPYSLTYNELVERVVELERELAEARATISRQTKYAEAVAQAVDSFTPSEYDGIVNGRLDPRDAEADFVMRGSDWREIRQALRSLPSSITRGMDDLADKLHDTGDSAYCRACDLSQRDLCLGEEHKIKTGAFTLDNLKALEKVCREFGRADGLWEAAKVVRSFLSASGQHWRQIESAPKDETTVLLKVPTLYGKWNESIAVAGRWEPRDNDAGFWTIFNADEAVQRVEPTHWMPVPD